MAKNVLAVHAFWRAGKETTVTLDRSSRRVFALVVLATSVHALPQSTTRISVSSSGVQGDGWSDGSSMSADGRSIVYSSYADNLVPGDTNGTADVFLYDTVTAQTTILSHKADGTQAGADCYGPVISRDGHTVAFISEGSLVPPDTNAQADVFVRNLLTGEIVRASVDSNGGQSNGYSTYCSLSADGRYVCFSNSATNLAPGATSAGNKIFVHDMQTGRTTVASTDSSGVAGVGQCLNSSITADGRYVVFESWATNLVPGDANGTADVFLHDMLTGSTTLISAGPGGVQGNGASLHPVITPDGRFVAFWSWASNFIVGDTNGFADVYVLDRATSLLRRASVSTGGAEADVDVASYFATSSDVPAISEDGRFVAFDSYATTLVAGDTNGKLDVFVHDMASGETMRVDVSTSGEQTNDHSGAMSISADGRYVSFGSYATNLVSGDANLKPDVFLRDRLGEAASVVFCTADGVLGICPCANSGSMWRGCDNSSATGGAQLLASGTSSPDTRVLDVTGERPSAFSIFLQGNAQSMPGVAFGDGLRCISGSLKRLYAKTATAGAVSAPGASDNPITVQSALLGDPIAPGSTRYYQTYYRDPSLTFCPAPQGNTWNISSAASITW
jgi:Tol biopolymer transport system component